jgi:hypothetical protein
MEEDAELLFDWYVYVYSLSRHRYASNGKYSYEHPKRLTMHF